MIFQETESIELKRNLNETFEKEVVAFLNTHNGVIYIGVEDDGMVVGVNKLDEVMKNIADIISNGILPNPQELIEVSAKYEAGKMIIEVKVSKGDSLYYIKKYGRSSKGCYIRVGTSCRSMTEQQIENKFGSIYLSNNDITQIESNRTKLSFKQLKIYYGEKKFHLSDDTFEDNLDLKTRNGKYNLLAELLSDENRISIKIARFRGIDKSELVEKSEYGYQCLLVAIDRMINRLEAENYTMSVIQGAQRVDKRLLNQDALREIFINAIAHNDWTKVEPAVYIFSDRIEIISHGGLPQGQTKEMFFKGVSTPRNKSLMRILSDLDYVEQTGHGIPDVIKIYG
ncbi:MAG: putative DNA binding domain-containing protein, partial [Anaeroplasmataceae bacterium]|nr:putative DNA binding domain-containing protein [Anaeroplasmataceae bacterium]